MVGCSADGGGGGGGVGGGGSGGGRSGGGGDGNGIVIRLITGDTWYFYQELLSLCTCTDT